MCCLETLSKRDVTAQAIWSPHGQNPGDSHKKYHKSGKIIDKETLRVTAVSPQFALCDCPEKGFCAPSLEGEMVLTQLGCAGRHSLDGVGPWPWQGCQGCIPIPNRWGKAGRVMGMERGEPRAGDGSVGATAGPLLSCCPGIPWVGKITREPLFNWLELLIPGEIKKRCKACNIWDFNWPQSLDTLEKKNQNTIIPQSSTQSFAWLDDLVSFNFPVIWNLKIWD